MNHETRKPLEENFFAKIDDDGAKAISMMLDHQMTNLSDEQRSDFARFLASLKARRPKWIKRLCEEGRNLLADRLDECEELWSLLQTNGDSRAPSSYAEQNFDSLTDRALATIQRIVDNPKLGQIFVKSRWRIRRIDKSAGGFVLADFPFIQTKYYKHVDAVWLMPLTPDACFIAARHAGTLETHLRKTDQRFCKDVNVMSARQAERFVFSVNGGDKEWLAKYLKRSVSRESECRPGR